MSAVTLDPFPATIPPNAVIRVHAATSTAISRPPPSLDNIFKPRRSIYSEAELAFLVSMIPIGRLPVQCYPKHNPDIQPPVFLIGWLIDVPEMRKQAAERGIECVSLYRRRGVDGSVDPVATKVFDAAFTFRIYVLKVLQELQIELPLADCTNLAWVPNPNGPELTAELVFVIYNNYTVSQRPSNEDIERICGVLGVALTGRVQYFANASMMKWTYL